LVYYCVIKLTNKNPHIMSTTIKTTSKNFFFSIKKYLFDNGIFYSYSAENERYTLNILGLTQQESKELLTKFLIPQSNSPRV